MAKKRVLDFTNVKEQGDFNPVRVPEGEARLKIVAVSDEASSKGNEMWTFKMQLVGRATATYPYRCTLNVEALWKVRNLFVAAGVTVPKKKVNVDPTKIVGREIGAIMVDDEYDGKIKSVVDSVFPASDLPESAPAKKSKAVKEDIEEEEEIEEVDDEIEVDDL